MEQHDAIQSRVERLCEHHDIAAFNCTEVEYNDALRKYFDDTRLSVLPRVYVTVVGNNTVTGYIAACDIIFQATTGPIRLFFIPHLAVSQDRLGTNDAAMLVSRVFELLDALEQSGKLYVGIAAAPNNNRDLTDVIEASGFRQYNEAFWVLRRLKVPT